MSRWRKRPIVVHAICNDGEVSTLVDWVAGLEFVPLRPPITHNADGSLSIVTAEGTMIANGGEWVIRGVKGEFYPCKPDIFEATYEPS